MVSCDEQPSGRSGLKETSAHVVAWLQLAWHHIAPLCTTPLSSEMPNWAEVATVEEAMASAMRAANSKTQKSSRNVCRMPNRRRAKLCLP